MAQHASAILTTREYPKTLLPYTHVAVTTFRKAHDMPKDRNTDTPTKARNRGRQHADAPSPPEPKHRRKSTPEPTLDKPDITDHDVKKNKISCFIYTPAHVSWTLRTLLVSGGITDTFDDETCLTYLLRGSPKLRALLSNLQQEVFELNEKSIVWCTGPSQQMYMAAALHHAHIDCQVYHSELTVKERMERMHGVNMQLLRQFCWSESSTLA
ncbi:hypothetical protein BO85DRAFT_438142 [Aspergillus piperis CBS 112811]|uniref:Uncharacterized protein n=1 Tax=Aspergillus piperis CBS 112811 TaxID=1448313 RepID=A0A8G1R6Z4_9EURO|nr:hypothetical protein BO85DRAFT_438142 [Aspergillus piperis CBS 112811]RAH57910.1 hypothetical protein BO85DRAFT_438142 [Aspergillus piperis CBS 112811]